MNDTKKIKEAKKLVRKAANLLEKEEELVASIEGAADSLSEAYRASESSIDELEDALGYVEEDAEENPAKAKGANPPNVHKLKSELLR